MTIYTITASYNGENLIRNCLNSLRTSTVKLHPIVIDNASVDNTIEIIEQEYPEVQLIKNEKNLGFGRANNQGMSIALKEKADYVFLLNQDAAIEPDTIEKLVQAHKENPEYGILSPLHLSDKKDEFDPRFGALLFRECKEIYYNAFFKKPVKEIYQVSFVNAAAWLLPRKTLETVGGFNPLFFMYGEDSEYVKRIKIHKLKIGIITSCHIIHSRVNHYSNRSNKRKIQELVRRYTQLTLDVRYELKSTLSKYSGWFTKAV